MFNLEASLIEELEGCKEADGVNGKFWRLDFPSYFILSFGTIFSLSFSLYARKIIKGY